MKDVDTKQDKSNKYPQATITFFICFCYDSLFTHI